MEDPWICPELPWKLPGAAWSYHGVAWSAMPGATMDLLGSYHRLVPMEHLLHSDLTLEIKQVIS
jgi:hypothetical protein